MKNKTVMVFGGTGTIGSGIVEQLLTTEVRQIRIFSNDENSLFETKQQFGNHKIRYLLGDIRNMKRVKRALEGVDYVFNCAAVKHISIAEYNPIELINVNVMGLNNVIDACFHNGVEKMVHVSTDKAVEPTSLMGMSKAIGERLCWIRNNSRGINTTKISCVRFGNVYGSRGSLVPIVKECLKNNKPILITSYDMKRYFITINSAAKFILDCLLKMKGGEIFVPEMEEVLIIDVINDLIEFDGFDKSNVKFKEIGIREGEKLREKLYTDKEYKNAVKKEGVVIINGKREIPDL